MIFHFRALACYSNDAATPVEYRSSRVSWVNRGINLQTPQLDLCFQLRPEEMGNGLGRIKQRSERGPLNGPRGFLD